MSHSVQKHLSVEIDDYDATIRRFIPGYETMLEVAAGAVASVRPGLVLDLGAGTGALSQAMLRQDGVGQVELLDVDAEMLTRARERLQAFKWRAQFRERSFLEPLPSCDAVAASLSLHHIPTIEEKRAMYRRILDSLWAGGVFVNADAAVPEASEERDATYRVWADHMVASGIEEDAAWRHFEAWAEEDTYFPLEVEIDAVRAAGFEAECLWQEGPMAVVVGRKK